MARIGQRKASAKRATKKIAIAKALTPLELAQLELETAKRAITAIKTDLEESLETSVKLIEEVKLRDDQIAWYKRRLA